MCNEMINHWNINDLHKYIGGELTEGESKYKRLFKSPLETKAFGILKIKKIKKIYFCKKKFAI